MTTEFRQWLVTVVSPERYQSRTALFDLLIDITGTVFQEIQTSLWSIIGVQDTLSILDRLDSECLVWSVQTIQRFGINLEDSQIGTEQQPLITEMMQALVHLDYHELPDELIQIIDAAEYGSDALCEMVALMYQRDSFDYLQLIKDVNPELIKRIREAAVMRKELTEEFDVSDIVPTEVIAKFKQVTQQVPLHEDDDVRNFFFNVGKLGLDIEAYVSVLGELLEVDDVPLLAKRWVWVTYASGGPDDWVFKAFELLYETRFIMQLNTEYSKLMRSVA